MYMDEQCLKNRLPVDGFKWKKMHFNLIKSL